ncbi:hypothetical protein BRADI_2g34162v3 [Brachypodium distachyon]|uniref:PB1 domain-containing protein n=1 Tax=Brachypodium distachyon TaxID=15368 RepID=A0A0Q3G9T4_BRADI|nr:hypothetical protein BRADI_2g34162v3 [Brachypodium distachyon]
MAAGQGEAKLMVSYGGRIERGSGEPRYVGGENLLVGVSRTASLRGFRARMAARAGFSCDDDDGCSFSVKYGTSGESLDALRDVACEADLRELLDKVLWRDLSIRLFRDKEAPRRVRVFLFRVAAAPSPAPASQALPAPVMRRSPTAPDFLAAEKNEKPAQPSADQAMAKLAVPPSPVRRVATAPASLADMAPPPSSGLPPRPPKRRIASAPSLSAPRKDDDTAASSSSSTVSTASAVAGTSVSSTGQDSGRNAQPVQVVHRLAPQQRSLALPAPVFLLPVAPVIVYQPAIILIVPAFSCNVVLG